MGRKDRKKKITAIGLAALMIFGTLGNTGVTARAEDGEPETEAAEVQSISEQEVEAAVPEVQSFSTTEEQEAIAQQSEVSNTIAVEINWGSLAFSYQNGQWDPETCTYIGGGWKPDQEGEALISVTNNGNVNVNVEYQFTAEGSLEEVKNLRGMFVNEEGQIIQVMSVPADGTAKKAELRLESDKPTASFEKTIGTINIVIKE